jgi:hypothetical protein
MRHGFGVAGMLQLCWVVILLARFAPVGIARWKAARRERLAVNWPVMSRPGGPWFDEADLGTVAADPYLQL